MDHLDPSASDLDPWTPGKPGQGPRRQEATATFYEHSGAAEVLRDRHRGDQEDLDRTPTGEFQIPPAARVSRKPMAAIPAHYLEPEYSVWDRPEFMELAEDLETSSFLRSSRTALGFVEQHPIAAFLGAVLVVGMVFGGLQHMGPANPAGPGLRGPDQAELDQTVLVRALSPQCASPEPWNWTLDDATRMTRRTAVSNGENAYIIFATSGRHEIFAWHRTCAPGGVALDVQVSPAQRLAFR